MFYRIRLEDGKIVNFDTRSFLPSGCSSKLNIVEVNTDGPGEWGAIPDVKGLSEFARCCGFGELAQGGKYQTMAMGVVGSIGPIAPHFAAKMKHDFVWVMKTGGITAGVFSSSSAPTHDLAKGMFDLPYYIIDPQKMASMKSLFRLGMFRETTLSRRKLSRIKLKQLEGRFTIDEAGMTEIYPDHETEIAKAYFIPVKHYCNAVNSVDLCPECGNTPDMPWWERWRYAGYSVPHASLLTNQIAQHLTGKSKSSQILFVAGNYGTEHGFESIRIVTYLQSLMEETGWRFDEPHHLIVNGKKVYYTVLPFVYRSVHHGEHNVSCAMLSDVPITFERGSEHEPI